MTKRESELRIAFSRIGGRLFRNETGLFYTKTGGRVQAGLCKGSADLIGWTPAVFDGYRVAIFTALEVKQGSGRLTKEQRAFLDAVRQAGGYAAEVRDDDDVKSILQKMGRHDHD